MKTEQQKSFSGESIDSPFKQSNGDILERGQSLERTVEWREGGVFFKK